MSSKRKSATDKDSQSKLNKLLNAIKKIKIEKQSITQTAKSYKIPKTNLMRYLSRLDDELADFAAASDSALLDILRTYIKRVPPTLVFTAEAESVLVRYVVYCCKNNYGLRSTDLRQLAYQFAKKIGAQYSPSWDQDSMTSRRWYYGFMSRHKELSLHTSENSTENQVKVFSKENFDYFFANLQKDLSATQYEPDSNLNMDETAFSTVPNNNSIVTSAEGVKRVGKLTTVKPEIITELHEKKGNSNKTKVSKALNPTKTLRKTSLIHPKPPKKLQKKNLKRIAKKSALEEMHFCIICMDDLPLKLTKNNSVACNKCQSPVHLKCANTTKCFFTCKHCDSDDDTKSDAPSACYN